MSDPFEKMRYNKKSLLALFVMMSKSDDDIDDSEKQFIEDMRIRLGISIEELDHIWKNEEDYPLEPPKSEKHRMTIMIHLLYLIAIDGVITKEERDLMHEVGLKLAIKPSLLGRTRKNLLYSKQQNTHTDSRLRWNDDIDYYD